MAGSELVFGVSDFVAYLNQTLETAYPYVTIEGELSNFRVSRNRWVYFDLKDEVASVRFFGTVYALPGPLEDGMLVRVSGSPRLHEQYGFSVNVQSIQPVGEGSLRRAADLLQAKLAAEGLFDVERKRSLPYPPSRIGLVTAGGSAAYADFIKILTARWAGVQVDHYDVLVQGEQAPAQIVQAIARANAAAELPDVLVITRGGGSADDLAAFSNEQVTRAVAASRVPTLVAIGHEVDLSLAELAADQRASTPSNAAELLTPDKKVIGSALRDIRASLDERLLTMVRERRLLIAQQRSDLNRGIQEVLRLAQFRLASTKQVLTAYDPAAALRRGYALVRKAGEAVRGIETVVTGDTVQIVLSDGMLDATITGKEQYGNKEI